MYGFIGCQISCHQILWLTKEIPEHRNTPERSLLCRFFDRPECISTTNRDNIKSDTISKSNNSNMANNAAPIIKFLTAASWISWETLETLDAALFGVFRWQLLLISVSIIFRYTVAVLDSKALD